MKNLLHCLFLFDLSGVKFAEYFEWESLNEKIGKEKRAIKKEDSDPFGVILTLHLHSYFFTGRE